MVAKTKKPKRLRKLTAHQKYILADGSQVPGASTIAKLGDDQSNLIHWAWGCGMKNHDYKSVSGRACDVGTIAHFLIEGHLKGFNVDLSEFSPVDIASAQVAFQNFLDWWKDQGLAVIEPEVQLVSEEHRFGGTIDAPCVDRDGKMVLLDWKTSKNIYPTHRFQLAAYEQLWNENRPKRKIERRGILRIGKTRSDDFEVAWMQSSLAEWEVFKSKILLHEAFSIYNRT